MRRKKELAELPFVSRFAEEYGEETGANLHCKSRSKHGTMFVEHMTSWRTFKLIHFWNGDRTRASSLYRRFACAPISPTLQCQSSGRMNEEVLVM